jgi:5'-nucleotidase
MKHLLLSLSLIATTALYASSTESKPLSLQILHINDHHSHLDPSKLDLKFDGKTKTRVKVGGIARVATKINELRTPTTLVLHAGDANSGTLYYTLFKGKADVEMMNEIGFDAFTLGNHEFDGGDEILNNFINQAQFPIISANVEVKKGSALDEKWDPYIIKDIDGQKVGIIGIEIAQKTKVSSMPSDDIIFYDEAVRAQRYADELKAQGVNKIILLSHFGYENDLELLSKVTGIDVIIDGDSHTLMGDFSAVGLKSPVATYPVNTKDKAGNPVCIAQAWEYSKVLGELHVSFDAAGTITECKGTPHLLLGNKFKQKNAKKKRVDVNDTVRKSILSVIAAQPNLDIVAKDEGIKSKIAVYKTEVDKLKKKKIGRTAKGLKHIRIPLHDYNGNNGKAMPLGSEIAPIVSKSFYDLSLRADACIQNAGGVRISLPEGKITYNTAYTLLPFSNTLYEIDMKGSEIKQVLEDALINFKDNGGSSGSFPYAYGLRYDIDMTKPKNQRILNLEIMDRKTKKWSLIDSDKLYVIVTNSYTAQGRDGYTTFKEVQKERPGTDTYLDYAMSFVAYVKAKTKEGKKIKALPKEEHCIKSYKE